MESLGWDDVKMKDDREKDLKKCLSDIRKTGRYVYSSAERPSWKTEPVTSTRQFRDFDFRREILMIENIEIFKSFVFANTFLCGKWCPLNVGIHVNHRLTRGKTFWNPFTMESSSRLPARQALLYSVHTQRPENDS